MPDPASGSVRLCNSLHRTVTGLVPTPDYAALVASANGGNGNGRKAKDAPSGKLELTWTNKDQALLAHEDGSYEWVPKRDRRVAEVRLLHDAGTVGEVFPDAV